MKKSEIITDWLSVYDNRGKLLKINVNKSQSEMLFSMANVYRFEGGIIIFEINETFFIPEFTEPLGISTWETLNAAL